MDKQKMHEERYQFTWPGKREAMLLADTPVSKVLIPCREESVDFDRTKNLYIEADNLDALKLLRTTHRGKIKMIYIDPPYNTRNEYIYEDNFVQTVKEYLDDSGQMNTGKKLTDEEAETDGRFHVAWLNMMYPRIKLAKDLLREDGVIYISIDDTEQDNLKKICNEIFGESNFVAAIVWKRKRGRDNSAKWFSKAHEYCLVYAVNKNLLRIGRLEIDERTKAAYKNPDNDPRGNYRLLGCWARGTQGGVKYDFTTKDGRYFTERLWLFSKEKLRKMDMEDKLVIRGDRIYRKMFISENKGRLPETIWDDVSNTADASDEIKRLFGVIVFETPKPTAYIQRMIELSTSGDDIILDFFSGSATTAHAVMIQNAADHAKRKFIMIQLPASVLKNSIAGKHGFENICEMGKERIRRAGREIKDQYGQVASGLDIGFQVLKCVSGKGVLFCKKCAK